MIPPWALTLLGELGSMGAQALRDWLAGPVPLEQEPMRSVGVGDLVVVLGVAEKRAVGHVVAIHSIDVVDVDVLDGAREGGLLRGREVRGWQPL